MAHLATGTKRRLLRSLALLAALATGGGCASTLVMSTIDGGTHRATITYTGVKDTSRRFPDYSGIDRSILASRGKP